MVEKWYQKGLRFECTGCGKCCSGAQGHVWVTKEEIQAMADFLNLSLDLFVKRYVRQVGQQYSLREIYQNGSYDCVFLKDNQCQVYTVRPRQCKTYPFWPDIVKSKQNWSEEALHCEGINERAPKVSFERIEKSLKK